ncbi:MAG: carboxypeptidase-like regulatory domain-containing protein, partial [Acidobacteria bacterium]|nr:carboxypeptidase-like regulatory domain-containing protein [Acidobacteriota bacterium]
MKPIAISDLRRRCSMTGFNRFSVFPRRAGLALGALTIFFLAAAVDGRAQTTFGSITGNVTDANGAIVAGATIEATHVRSNYRYTVRSNEVGNFTLPQLREGEYTLRANATG